MKLLRSEMLIGCSVPSLTNARNWNDFRPVLGEFSRVWPWALEAWSLLWLSLLLVVMVAVVRQGGGSMRTGQWELPCEG